MTDPAPGRIEQMTRADVGAMVSSHPMGEALSEMAFAAARRLDGDVEDKSYPGIMRQLQAVLVELTKYAAAEVDDLDDELSAPTEGQGG